MRTAGPEDAGRLAELHGAAFLAPWSASDFRELLQSPGVAAVLDPHGFILVRALAGEAEILTLAVAPEARRRGLGRALIEAGAQAAAAAGAEAMFLEVAADNAPALGLYAAAGFEPVGVRRGYYPRPGGAAADARTLRRALSPSGA